MVESKGISSSQWSFVVRNSVSTWLDYQDNHTRVALTVDLNCLKQPRTLCSFCSIWFQSVFSLSPVSWCHRCCRILCVSVHSLLLPRLVHSYKGRILSCKVVTTGSLGGDRFSFSNLIVSLVIKSDMFKILH